MLPARALACEGGLYASSPGTDSPPLPCSATRGGQGLGLGQLCWGMLTVLVGTGDFCSNPLPLWPLLPPQHTLKMLEPASTL